VQTQPFGINAHVTTFPFPESGFFSDLMAMNSPEMSMGICTGKTEMQQHYNGSLDEVPLREDRFYLYFLYTSSFEFAFADVTVETAPIDLGSGMFILDPIDPFIYLSGDIFGAIPSEGLNKWLNNKGVDPMGIGFSLNGLIPYSSDYPLYDGTVWIEENIFEGHFYASGAIQLGELPVNIEGSVLVDVDANDDNEVLSFTDYSNLFEDILIGINGSLTLGYNVAGFDISIDLAHGTALYECGMNKLLFRAKNAENPIAGLFDPIMNDPGGTSFDIYGFYDRNIGLPEQFMVEDVFIHSEGDYSCIGYKLASSVIEFTMDGVSIEGNIHVVGNNVHVTGVLQSDGTFILSAVANINILGHDLANAIITFSNLGLYVVGSIQIGDTWVTINGKIEPDGIFSLTGAAEMTISGFQLAQADVILDNDGCSVDGTLSIIGNNVTVIGTVDSTGIFSLQGSTNMTVAGLQLAQADVILDNDGCSVEGTLSIIGNNVTVSGDVFSNGSFSLGGSATMIINGFRLANTKVELSNNGCYVSGDLSIAGNSVVVGGTVYSDGTFSLKGETILTLAGYRLSKAEVTFSNYGVTVAGDVNIGISSVRMSGSIDSDGTFSLTGSGNISIIGYTITSASVTLRNSGLTGIVYVTYAGTSFNVNFTVKTNGQINGCSSISIGGSFAGFTVEGSVELCITNNVVDVEFCGEVGINLPLVGFVSVNTCTSVSSSGEICVNIPVYGNACIDIL